MDAALETTGVFPIREYVRRREVKLLECVAGILIYKLFTGAERMEGSSRFLRWWYQDHVTNQTKREVD